MSGRAKQIVEVSKALLDDMGARVVPLPPDPWFVRGPNGGLYQATGKRSRRTEFNPWDYRQMGYVIDESEDTRYIRPGSKRYAEAKESIRRA